MLLIRVRPVCIAREGICVENAVASGLVSFVLLRARPFVVAIIVCHIMR